MKSHELLRDIFNKFGPKEIAGLFRLSLSSIYKLSHPGADGNSEVANPLDRLEVLLRHTRDVRLAEWVCQRAGGFFVRDPLPQPLAPELLCAENDTELAMAELHCALTAAARKGHITDADAAVIRSHWQRVKSVSEGFVQACERGAFQLMLVTSLLSWCCGGEGLFMAEA